MLAGKRDVVYVNFCGIFHVLFNIGSASSSCQPLVSVRLTKPTRNSGHESIILNYEIGKGRFLVPGVFSVHTMNSSITARTYSISWFLR